MIAESISLGVLSLPAAVATLGLVPLVILYSLRLRLWLIARRHDKGGYSYYWSWAVSHIYWICPWPIQMEASPDFQYGRRGWGPAGSVRSRAIVRRTNTVPHIPHGRPSCDLHGCTELHQRPCDLFNGLWCCWACDLAHLFSAPDDEEYLMAFYTVWVRSYTFTIHYVLCTFTTNEKLAAFISILSGVFVTMISVGITKPGTGAAATTKTNLYHGFSAVSNIVFSYGERLWQIYSTLYTNSSMSSSRAYRVL